LHLLGISDRVWVGIQSKPLTSCVESHIHALERPDNVNLIRFSVMNVRVLAVEAEAAALGQKAPETQYFPKFAVKGQRGRDE
jgi:hypothetical protein